MENPYQQNIVKSDHIESQFIGDGLGPVLFSASSKIIMAIFIFLGHVLGIKVMKNN